MKKQYLAYALTGMMLFSASPHQIYAAQNTEDRIHMLGVAGDAILIESNGKFAMVDGGEDSDNPRGFEELEANYPHEQDVINYLKEIAGDKNGKVTLEFIIGTHAHSDHLGGLDTVINHPDITVKKIYLKEYNEDAINWEKYAWDNKEVYEQLLEAAKKNNVPVIHDLPTKSFQLEDFTLQLYNTELPDLTQKVGENENSLAIKVTKGQQSMLLAGDLNNLDGDEDRLAQQIGQVDFLKMGHHGHTNSSTPSFLRTLQPKVVFSNVGGDQDVRDSLLEIGATHYAVELNDGIIVDFNDGDFLKNKSFSVYQADNYTYHNQINEPDQYFHTWSFEKGYWEYLKPNGKPTTGWHTISWKNESSTYYFDKTGRMVTGWQYLDWQGKSEWYYFDNSGRMKRGLNYLEWNGEHSWYHLGKSGNIQSGWIQDGDTWYYADSSGKIQTGWQYLNWKGNSEWYYFNEVGQLQTGWQYLEWKGEYHWYYFDEYAQIKTGWQKLNWNGKTSWYYFNSGGAMQTGWLKDSGKTYYLNHDGSMVTGSKWINGKLYRFNASGELI